MLAGSNPYLWRVSWKLPFGDVARALACLDVLAAVEEQPRLLGMTIAIANNLATRLRCDRVSVGLRRRGGRLRLSAISHSATFKKAGRLVDAIESAMEEAIDQRASVTYPPSRPDGTRCHNGPSRARGGYQGA